MGGRAVAVLDVRQRRDIDEEPTRTESVASTEAPASSYEDQGYDEMGW